jgi:hypothetical protein
MISTTATTRVYLDAHQTGVITCLACGVQRSLDLTRYGAAIGGSTLYAKCTTCGGTFRILLDRRRHRRVHVQLPGQLLQLRTRASVDPIVVTSLSVTGLRFVTRPTLVLHAGERYEVVFLLDDADCSAIFDTIVITRRRGNIVGAAFEAQESYRDELGFYIMSTGPMPGTPGATGT